MDIIEVGWKVYTIKASKGVGDTDIGLWCDCQCIAILQLDD